MRITLSILFVITITFLQAEAQYVDDETITSIVDPNLLGLTDPKTLLGLMKTDNANDDKRRMAEEDTDDSGSEYQGSDEYQGSGDEYQGSGDEYQGSGDEYQGSGDEYQGSGSGSGMATCAEKTDGETGGPVLDEDCPNGYVAIFESTDECEQSPCEPMTTDMDTCCVQDAGSSSFDGIDFNVTDSDSFTDGLSDVDVDYLLGSMNGLRESKDAANMRIFSWSDNLAEDAQAQAETCPSASQGMGEVFAEADTVLDAFEAWLGQGEYYSYRRSSCGGEDCNAYFQMVWAHTGYVGCGAAQCMRDGDGSGESESYGVVVCQFNAIAPQLEGNTPYDAGVPCTKCRAGLTCDYDGVSGSGASSGNKLCDYPAPSDECDTTQLLATVDGEDDMVTFASGEWYYLKQVNGRSAYQSLEYGYYLYFSSECDADSWIVDDNMDCADGTIATSSEDVTKPTYTLFTGDDVNEMRFTSCIYEYDEYVHEFTVDVALDSVFRHAASHSSIIPALSGYTSFSSEPALPKGLVLDPTIGELYGSPLVASNMTSYVFTASDEEGNTAEVTFTITVLDGAEYKQMGISADADAVFASDEATTEFAVNVQTDLATSLGIKLRRVKITEMLRGSVIVKFAILPSSDPTEPSVEAAAADLEDQIADTSSALYSGSVTSSSIPDSLVSLPPPPSWIIYTTDGTNSVMIQEATTLSLVASNSGGDVTTWSITPDLPAGISFSTTDGSITGMVPLVSEDTTTQYTVTASNDGGSATTIFTLTIENKDEIIVPADDDDDNSNLGLVIGLVFGFAFCIPLTVFACLRLKQEKEKQAPGIDEEVQGDFGDVREPAAQKLVANPNKMPDMEMGMMSAPPAEIEADDIEMHDYPMPNEGEDNWDDADGDSNSDPQTYVVV